LENSNQETDEETKATASDTRLVWYRSSVVWLGILITIIIVFGYVRLVVISHQNNPEQPLPTAETDHKQLSEVLGMPLSRNTGSRNTRDTSVTSSKSQAGKFSTREAQTTHRQP
jgi:hypothetical protein